MASKDPLPAVLAAHLRAVHTGGNWTVSDLQQALKDVSWEQAITPVADLNTIATLVHHIHYFIGEALLKVLRGGPLDTKDSLSFAHPPIRSQQDWDNFLATVWADAESCAAAIEQLPEERCWEPFIDPKYGTWYRNLQGVIEHTHYHLGQIVLIKKILAARDPR